MSWNQLNNHELQAMRKLLMLDVSEAAEHIGKVSVRTWQYWETGRSNVPGDVEMEMYALIQFRTSLIENISTSHKDGDQIKYYHAFEEWLEDGHENNKVQWKIWQSAVAEVFASQMDIELI